MSETEAQLITNDVYLHSTTTGESSYPDCF